MGYAYSTNPDRVLTHPRFPELREVFGHERPETFHDLSSDELARLSDSERAELVALLEAREVAKASPVDRMIAELWVSVAALTLDDADESACPDAYLTAALAHERCRRAHERHLIAQRRPKPTASLAEYVEWHAEVWPSREETARLAAADGFPPPGEVVGPREVAPARQEFPLHVTPPLPRAVADDLAITRARAIPEQVVPESPSTREQQTAPRPWWAGRESNGREPAPWSDGV